MNVDALTEPPFNFMCHFRPIFFQINNHSHFRIHLSFSNIFSIFIHLSFSCFLRNKLLQFSLIHMPRAKVVDNCEQREYLSGEKNKLTKSADVPFVIAS
jgi:hypothetical protein